MRRYPGPERNRRFDGHPPSVIYSSRNACAMSAGRGFVAELIRVSFIAFDPVVSLSSMYDSCLP